MANTSSPQQSRLAQHVPHCTSLVGCCEMSPSAPPGRNHMHPGGVGSARKGQAMMQDLSIMLLRPRESVVQVLWAEETWALCFPHQKKCFCG